MFFTSVFLHQQSHALQPYTASGISRKKLIRGKMILLFLFRETECWGCVDVYRICITLRSIDLHVVFATECNLLWPLNKLMIQILGQVGLVHFDMLIWFIHYSGEACNYVWFPRDRSSKLYCIETWAWCQISCGYNWWGISTLSSNLNCW